MSEVPAPILQLLSVSKGFDGAPAVRAIDLEVPTGRTAVLLGSSGSGKTTVLRLMLGLLPPDSGQVLFRQAPLTPERLVQARLQMGYVIQDGGLFPHLTARANVELMARHLGWPKRRIQERVSELSHLVQISEGLLARNPTELSGGQKQRVALMRALMLDPELLLLDEPLGALDPLVRADLQEELSGIFERLAKSVVLVTHDLREAARLGHVLVLLHEGRVVQKGSLADFRSYPADPFVTRFVGAQSRCEARPETAA